MVGFAALMLAACGNEKTEIQQSDDEKAKAKTETSSESTETKEDKAKKEDIWTYYEDATWDNDYQGLKQTIQKVVVSNEAPMINDEGKEEIASAVGVKFKIENTTDGKFVTYPDQATLVTSTGEQIDASMIASDHIGGEIDKGVIKEGGVIFYLERGEADKIEWVKLSWNGHKGGDDEVSEEYKEFEVELKLK